MNVQGSLRSEGLSLVIVPHTAGVQSRRNDVPGYDIFGSVRAIGLGPNGSSGLRCCISEGRIGWCEDRECFRTLENRNNTFFNIDNIFHRSSTIAQQFLNNYSTITQQLINN